LSASTEHTLSRRDFLAMAALGAAAACVPRGTSGTPGEDPIYVGTYTTDGRSKGIYLVMMTRDTGALRLVGNVAETTEPSFVAASKDGRFVYAVNETTEYEGKPSGAVSAFARDGATGKLTLINKLPTNGGAPCYVTLDNGGKFVFVANYVGGSVAVFPIRDDGGLGAMTSFVQHAGSGPDKDRQSSPHAHCIIPDPSNRFVLVADLGLDRVLVYGFDASTGKLLPLPGKEAAMAPGAGPRHLAFHANGRIVYVVNELDSTITTLRYDAGTGALEPVQTIPTVSEPVSVRNAPADIHVHPSGRFVYMSNRGHDSIAAFAIDATFTLRPLQLVSTGGKWPRNFAIDPSGRFLFVANQRSDTIVTLAIDTATGRLMPTGRSLVLPAPVCLRFL
jgi:6-phosphogluconolactonase